MAEELATAQRQAQQYKKERDKQQALVTAMQTHAKHAAAEVRAEANASAEAKHAGRVKVARARARKAERGAALSRKRQKRAAELKLRVEQLNDDVDDAHALADVMRENRAALDDALATRRDQKGRFRAAPWYLRPLVWAQLGRRTPPSAINRNITDVLYAVAPQALVPLWSDRELRKMRGELTIAGECIAAFRIASARRIISFGFDESTKWGLGLMSTNVQIEPRESPGTSIDVVPRGATLTAGGTAVEISSSVNTKIFVHARTLLGGWRELHEKVHGEGSWAADGGPDPSQVGIHRLAEHSLIMSDTCNAARAAKRLLADLAEAAARENLGTVAVQVSCKCAVA